MHKRKKQCLCTIVCEVLLLASNSCCQVLRSSATSPAFPPRTEYPLLRSGREQNPAVIADKLRSLSQYMVWNLALFTDQREWFCQVLTLPRMDLQNHPDLIPPSSVLSSYPTFSWNSWVFSLRRSIYPVSLPGHCWLTALWLPPHVPLVFQHPGKHLLLPLYPQLFTSALPLPSPALPFPAPFGLGLPKALPSSSQSLGLNSGCSRAGCGQWEFLPQTRWPLCNYWYLIIALAPL